MPLCAFNVHVFWSLVQYLVSPLEGSPEGFFYTAWFFLFLMSQAHGCVYYRALNEVHCNVVHLHLQCTQLLSSAV